MHSYYRQKQWIPLVTRSGTIIGAGERWDVHKKGILHRGFTVLLTYNNCILLQRRRHPVFDNVVDATSSSHPLVLDGKMEDEREAVRRCIRREWRIKVPKRKRIRASGTIVYKAKDKAGYIEHEFCTFYHVPIVTVEMPNFAYAYGFELIERDYFIKNYRSFALAPWVKKGIQFL